MKNLLMVLFLAVNLAPQIGRAQEKVIWTMTTDFDHNCSINFPGLPTNTNKNTAEGMKFTSYVIYGQSTYILKVIDLKSEPKDKVAKAKKRIQSLATKFKGKVTEESDWLEGTRKGISSRVNIAETGKPEMLMIIKVIVVGKIQYEVSAMMPLELYDPAFDDNFLNSFQFLQ
jgi:hypothetical protein